MFFSDEPAWMQKVRNVPLRSDWESRQPIHPTKYKKASAPFGAIPGTHTTMEAILNKN